MASLTKFHYPHQTFNLNLNHQTQSQPKPYSYQILQKPHRSHSIKATSSPKSSFLKSTIVTLTTSAALLSASFHLATKPATASPPPPPPPPSTTTTNLTPESQISESDLENHLSNNPNDTEALQSLLQIKFETKNIEQAVQILNRLIEIEPEQHEWRILKAQIQIRTGDFDSAIKGFEELLTKDQFCIEAYHGLIMAYSGSESKLPELENRINEVIEKCKDSNIRNKEFRELMLLIAQIKVIQGNVKEALKVYQELVKDEPKDFRPYLCQGLIYTLMKKKDEAEKQFEEFRRLVPENHPYNEYFDANGLNTNKIFAK